MPGQSRFHVEQIVKILQEHETSGLPTRTSSRGSGSATPNRSRRSSAFTCPRCFAPPELPAHRIRILKTGVPETPSHLQRKSRIRTRNL